MDEVKFLQEIKDHVGELEKKRDNLLEQIKTINGRIQVMQQFVSSYENPAEYIVNVLEPPEIKEESKEKYLRRLVPADRKRELFKRWYEKVGRDFGNKQYRKLLSPLNNFCYHKKYKLWEGFEAFRLDYIDFVLKRGEWTGRALEPSIDLPGEGE